MNRRFSHFFVLVITIVVNSAVLAQPPTFHWGKLLIYPQDPVTGDYFYGLYEPHPKDALLKGNLDFLYSYLPEPETGEKSLKDLHWVRTLKLIGSDSIFVHVYDWPILPSHKYAFLLVDTKRDRRLFLNEFSPESFSQFWSGYYDDSEDSDYLLLSRLYLVFRHIDGYIYFVKDPFDIGMAHSVAGGPGYANSSGLTSNDLFNSEAEWAKRITEPCVRRKKDHIEVEMYLYVLNEVEVYRYKFYYQQGALTYIDSKVISPSVPPERQQE